MRTRQWVPLFGCILLASLIGCGAGKDKEKGGDASLPPARESTGGAKPGASGDDKKARPAPVQSAEEAKEYPAEALGAVGLDGAKWEKEYVGKPLKVSGEVDSVGSPWVHLKTSKRHPTGQPVHVTLLFADPSGNKTLNPGDKILAEGKAGGIGFWGPTLENVKLVKVLSRATKEKAVEVTAVELSKAYKVNSAEAEKKYDRKLLVVTGVVNEITVDPDGSVTMLLAGDKDGMEIRCTPFYVVERKQIIGTVKKGQTIKVLGQQHGTAGNIWIILDAQKVVK